MCVWGGHKKAERSVVDVFGNFETKYVCQLAEGVRFELTVSLPTSVFKTGALNHSATPPMKLQKLIWLRGKENVKCDRRQEKTAHNFDFFLLFLMSS